MPLRFWRLAGRGDYLYSPAALRRLLEASLPYGRLEEAAVPLVVVATDLATGLERRLSAGLVIDAVLASAAIPGLFPPVRWEGALLVRCGIGASVPLTAAAAAWGSAEALVLDTTARPGDHPRWPGSAVDIALQAVALAATALAQGELACPPRRHPPPLSSAQLRREPVVQRLSQHPHPGGQAIRWRSDAGRQAPARAARATRPPRRDAVPERKTSVTTDIQQFATRLNDSLGSTGRPRSQPWLFRPLLQLLATGQPVSINQLADATGGTIDQVREAAGNPETEYDEGGRIVGSGLSQNPTPHRFEVDGRTLYTWCALDTLIFPAVLGRPAHVTSPCHATGTPVRVTVEPDRVTSVEPATVVVSIVTPDAPASIRAAFCNQVHFFASPDAARDWLQEHPGATVLPVADAYELGQPLTQTLLRDDNPPACC